MKNFRKVLALVLVVATLLSFATMASADYKDQASIAAKYELAVDVLTGFGIINGDETGNFRPTDEIDRDEVAKMVAVLCNGGEDIEAYYADACTFADTKNTWAAGYVAYCYHTGIIDGRNATTFDPNASITGYEVAKMLLCVLGFDADEQGYVGKDWKVNVLRDARNFGLLDGLDKSFNLKNNIKRQEVAQMMLTMLNKPVVVGVLSDNIVKVTNALYANLGYSIKDLGQGELALMYGNVIVSKDTLFEVYGYGYGITVDCYGRPYNVWSGKNTVTGKTWSIERPVAKGAALGAKAAADTYVFLNGEYVGATAKGAAYSADLSRKGLVVETYTAWNGTVIVAAFETEVAVVEDVYKWQGVTYVDIDFANAEWDDIEMTKNTAGYKGGEVLYATFCDGTDGTHGKKLALADRIEKDTVKFNATFTEATPVVVKVTDVNSTSEKLPANWTQANTTFYAGTTAYNYHQANVAGYYDGYSFDNDAVIAAVGGTYNVYMNNGYVIAWAPYVPADTATYGVAYFEGDSFYYVEGDKFVNGVRPVTYYLNDMIDFTAKDNDEVKTTKATVEDLRDYHSDEGVLAMYKVVDGVLEITDCDPYFDYAINLEKGEVGGVNGYQIVNSTKILVKIGGKYEAHDWASLKAKYGDLLISAVENVQYFVEGEKVTYLFIEATHMIEEGYFFVVDWTQIRTSTQIVPNQVTYADEYKVIINGEAALLWVDAEDGVNREDLIGGLFNIKVRYLGIELDGKPVYYVEDASQLLEVTSIEFDHIDSGKIFDDDGIVEHHLADNYTITVIDYTAAGKYVATKLYTTEAAFNAEFQDNAGYEYEAFVEMDAEGYVVNLFLKRTAVAGGI